jgi:hypothetical protein
LVDLLPRVQHGQAFMRECWLFAAILTAATSLFASGLDAEGTKYP